MNLSELKAAADAARDNLDLICRRHGKSRWDAYKELEQGKSPGVEIEAACDQYIAACHAFYSARWPKGVLANA